LLLVFSLPSLLWEALVMLTAWLSPSQAQSVLKSPECSLKEMKM